MPGFDDRLQAGYSDPEYRTADEVAPKLEDVMSDAPRQPCYQCGTTADQRLLCLTHYEAYIPTLPTTPSQPAPAPDALRERLKQILARYDAGEIDAQGGLGIDVRAALTSLSAPATGTLREALEDMRWLTDRYLGDGQRVSCITPRGQENEYFVRWTRVRAALATPATGEPSGPRLREATPDDVRNAFAWAATRPVEPSAPRELLCMLCGREHPVWSASNELWNAVMRSGRRAVADRYPFVCPTCFMLLAVELNVATMFKVSDAEAKAHECAYCGTRCHNCGEPSAARPVAPEYERAMSLFNAGVAALVDGTDSHLTEWLTRAGVSTPEDASVHWLRFRAGRVLMSLFRESARPIEENEAPK